MQSKRFRSVLAFCIFVIVGILFSRCGNRAETGSGGIDRYTAKDARGTTVSLNKPAERVVVLFEPMVDEFFMLQSGDCLVGIPEQVYLNPSSYEFLSQLDSRIAQKSIATPTFGGQSNNIESIIGLHPELVVVYEQDKEAITQLEGLHIPVYAVSSKNKESIYAELKGIAKLLDKEKRANDLIRYVEAELRKMDKPAREDRKKIYYAWSKGRILSTSGKGSLMDLCIEAAGAINACPLAMEAPNIGAEALYKWNPDIIVLWNSTLEDVHSLKELAALPAVRSERVYALSPTFYFDPHTIKFMLFAKQLRYWCYPEEPDGDLDRDIREALNTFYSNTVQ